MSTAAERPRRPELPAAWERLERAAEDAAITVALWKRRASEAEEEVARLRRGLEELAAEQVDPREMEEEIRRLRAENTALNSRIVQARRRLGALMRQVNSLGLGS